MLAANPRERLWKLEIVFVQDVTIVPKNVLFSGPCPPQRVAVDLQCGTRTAVLSWQPRSDVELYEASAVKTSGGGVLTCNATGATCPFAGLECGEMYNFTVRAQRAGCCSQASTAVLIQTGAFIIILYLLDQCITADVCYTLRN